MDKKVLLDSVQMGLMVERVNKDQRDNLGDLED